MSELAIRLDGVGKQYRIGARQASYRTLRETIVDAVATPFRRAIRTPSRDSSTPNNNKIWALKDVSFEVAQGEVVGIIGRNGAGKSTLLKILSRITKPTKGTVDVYGRIGSLLEVGTGFHPELTGRENTYLNGAILGMRKVEIERKFDEIVDFADVEKFLDTPLKRYSSGMQVRLAFAVAAHLDPEILLVDEVLAVGDAAFQRKCLQKMGAVAGEGRTILFVSHNMAAITSLCTRGILLEGGLLNLAGDAAEVVAAYQASTNEALVKVPLAQRVDREGNGVLKFTDVSITGTGTPSRDGGGNLTSGQAAVIATDYQTKDGRPLRNATFAIYITDLAGTRLFTCFTGYTGLHYEEIPAQGKVECRIARFPLAPGVYRLDLASKVGGDYADIIPHAAQFIVNEGDFFSTGKLPNPRVHGPFLVDHSWSIRYSAISIAPEPD